MEPNAACQVLEQLFRLGILGNRGHSLKGTERSRDGDLFDRGAGRRGAPHRSQFPVLAARFPVLPEVIGGRGLVSLCQIQDNQAANRSHALVRRGCPRKVCQHFLIGPPGVRAPVGVQKLRVGLEDGHASGAARGSFAQEQFRPGALPPDLHLPRFFNSILSMGRTDGDSGSQKQRARPHSYPAPINLV